jgi:hypothetical protein
MDDDLTTNLKKEDIQNFQLKTCDQSNPVFVSSLKLPNPQDAPILLMIELLFYNQ